HPERAIPALVAARAALDKLPDDARVRDARQRLDELLAATAGLYARATAASATAAPGTVVDITVELVARAAPVTVRRVEVGGVAPIAKATAIALGDKKLVTASVTLPAKATPSLAYWLAQAPQPGHYVVADRRMIGAPLGPPPLVATIDLTIGGRAVRLVRPVVHAWTDPVHGERVRPFVVAPPATVTPLREAVLAPGRAAPLDVRVRAHKDGVTGTVELALPTGWTAKPTSHALSLAKAGDEVTLRFEVKPRANAAAGEATPIVRIGGETWALREDVIDYPHIPVQLVLRPATLRLVPLELRVPAGRIAYVRGSGDTIPADLAHVGFQVEEIDDEMLKSGNLGRFSTIVLGIRAHNTRPAVVQSHARLVEYVRAGGTLIVQYTTLGDTGPLGPFPLEIG